MSATTLEDVWELFRKADERWARMEQEAEQRARETEQRARETEQREKQREKQRAKQRAQEQEKISQEILRVSRNVDALTNKWGIFVENMVAPACETLFAKWGIPVHEVHPRVRSKRPGISMEIDLMVVNDSHVILVEVKSSMRIEDIDRHLLRLGKFKQAFPKYADCHVHGAIAGVDQPEHVVHNAIKNRLFVLVQAGETMAILNPSSFKPRAW